MNVICIYFLLIVYTPQLIYSKQHYDGLKREKCDRPIIKVPNGDESIINRRLRDLRTQMQSRLITGGIELDAYIVTSFDEHLNEFVAEFDERRKFISGYSGRAGTTVITLKSQALWTDERFTELAGYELECDWRIFRIGEHPSISEWLVSQLSQNSVVGTDPRMVSHTQFEEWNEALRDRYLRLISIPRNLIDTIWLDNRPEPRTFSVKVHPINFAGEKWESKVQRLKSILQRENFQAMVVTSLTEIAYLFNLRGYDLPYTPVFKAYAVVTLTHVYLYTNRNKLSLGIEMHLKVTGCQSGDCVYVRNYNEIWNDIQLYSKGWRKVLVPGPSTFDHGSSEAIYSSLHRRIVNVTASPIIEMRAKKNEIERRGMREAHIRDASAFIDVMSYLEEKFLNGEGITELELSYTFDRARRAQMFSKGLSIPTTVAFGPHAGYPYYIPSNRSNAAITDQNVLLIESGAQYLDGTTDVSRTVHLGTASEEQKRAYTLTLQGLIRLSMLVFPENMEPGEIDVLLRGPQWNTGSDYPHGTGHGIGSFLAVHESPINIAYNSKQTNRFREGYFFTIEPGYYKPGYYGIRLENVLEVVDTNGTHPSGNKFLAFRVVTLVPFEPKLIDHSLLSAREKKWLNDYNARIREIVGAELKKRTHMSGFHWLMNKTRHIIEYLPEAEYKGSIASKLNITNLMIITCNLIRFWQFTNHFYFF